MSKHNHRVGRMAKNTWLAVLITAVVASTFAVLPVQPAAAQTSGLETIRAGSGDVAITQVVMTENGNTITQNSSVSGVIDADNDELKIESVTIVDGGQTVVLDEFNFTGIEVQNQNWGTNQSGVRTSENGVHTLPSHPDFWDRVEQVLGSTDLRDYLDVNGGTNPALTSFEPDFDFYFEFPVDNGDYVLITERNGNSFFDLEPLDADGNVIAGSKRLGFDAPYRWNTGYAPGDNVGQPMWFTVVDVEAFEVDTTATPIAGFRIDNDGEADVKFFALSDQSFTPTCPTGFYQVLSGRLHRLDVTTGQYEVLDSGTQGSYNAMAFRESEGVFYAISTANAADGSRRNGDLIRIDPSDGSITNTGLFVQAGAFTADIDPVTGLMHISNGGNNWKVVNLDTLQIVDALTFTSGDGQSRPSVADIAIIDGRAYGMQGDRLGVYDLNTLQHFRFDVQGVTGVSGLSGGWGSTYVTSGDQFYASNNPTGAIVWITDLDTNNPQGTRISTGQPTNNNDGGSCPSAPDPFGKVNANDDFVDVYPGTASAVPVMANDTAPAGSLPRILTTDGEGTFEIRDDGVVMYTPLLSELSQTRTFEYELCPGDFESGHPRCDTATVTMNVICAPGLPIEDRPAGITGSWSELQLDMWRAQLGDSTVTAELTNLSATQAVMDQLNSNDYSQPNVAGNPALEIVHDYSQSATLTLTFSPAVVDPVVHIGRLGGYVGLGGPLAVSNSSLLTLGDGLTWTVDSVHRNGSHFSATSNTVERRVGDLMNNPTLAMDAFNRGSSGGSLEITGTVDRIVLTLESSGTALAGSLDSFEILVTEPPVTACGGEALLQGSKIANTDMASAGGEIEWSLGTTSVGTGKAENTTITDVLPTGLRAVSIRTGAWAPSTTVAEFEYLKNGNWFDIATVDGDDDATYNLPANAEAVRITYPGGLDKAFATLAPARLVTDVFDPPMDGDTPAPIVNCATWAADNMAGREVCDLVQVDLNNSIPDLTVTTLTGSAVPGEQISFKIRIENLPAASRPYREPFVAVLLPEELSYASNQPLTQDEPPQLLVTENHNGTGRTLVRWDYRNAARDLTPGEVFDLVLNTTVRPAVSASSFDLVAMTGTNNTQYNVSCVDPAIADVYDVDGDGLVAESVCWDTDSFDVDALLDVEVNASAKGRDGMDFIIYDEVPGQGASVDVAPLVTGQDTFLDAMPDASTNAAWTASVNRVSNQTPADASDCGVPLSGDAPVLSQDCANGGARWFQRSFSLGSADRPASLVLVGDVATSGVGQIFVNGVLQGQELDEFGRVYLTGPWVAGVNLVEVEVDGDGGPSLLAASLAWYRTDDGSGTGAEAINIATSGRATQSTTATAWDTGNGPPIASRAIDGNTDGDYWHESVSHTAINTGNKWWQVDLGTVASIDSIEIWNRTDCCTTRLSGAKLFVSPDPITTKTVAGARGQAGVIEIPVTPDLSGPHHEFSVAGAAGRYVLIVLDTDEHLSLAEVQVNTHVAPAVAYTQLDSDWTVSESLDGPRRPAVSAARSCVPNWGAAPGGGSYLWGENCERPVYETTQFAAAELPNLDTGTDASGADLPLGSTDPMWDVTYNGSTNQATVVPNCATYAWNNIPAQLIWTPNCNNTGTATFTASFELPEGTGHESLSLSAQTWIDNYIDSVTVNGVSQGITDSGFSGTRPVKTLAGPFVPGTNTITIVTRNTGGPGALSIDFEWNGGVQVPVSADVNLAAPGSQANPFVDISQAQDVPSGVYWFDLEGVDPFQAEVDNSNGGGWVLVLNYVHKGGTNPSLDVRTDSLPISTDAALGADESGTNAWGHAGNDLFAALDADEVRFYAETSAHDRVIHFRTFEGISYFETGSGSMDLNGLKSNFTALEGHTSNLPATANSTYADRGNEALTRFPFYMAGTNHWGVGANGNRWEVDDYANNAETDTIHRVWVRSSDPWQNTSANTRENFTYFFHREFELSADDLPDSLEATARFLVDNSVTDIYVNGVSQGVGGSNWSTPVSVPLSGPFQVGTNTITFAVTNGDGPAAWTGAVDFSRSDFSCEEEAGHTSRPCIAQTTSHGPGSIRIELENNGNVATGGLVAYQVLPYPGDVSPLTGDPIGSQYTPSLSGLAEVFAKPSNVTVTVSYSMSSDPCRPELFGSAAGAAAPGGCDNDWTTSPEDLSAVRAVRVQATPGVGQYWAAGEDLDVRIPLIAPQGSWLADTVAFFPVDYVVFDADGSAPPAIETSHAGLLLNKSVNGIGGRVWLDENANGIQDPEEVGQNGVRIELYDVDRNLVATTYSQNLDGDTAQPGIYWFGDLDPGEYFVRLVRVPISWNMSLPDIGPDDIDSDIDPLTMEGEVLSIGATTLITDHDMGFFIPQGPAECVDNTPEYDPTDLDAERRQVGEASPCPA